MARRIVNVLFDLDGTLIDSFPGIARTIGHTLTSMGAALPPEHELRWCVGPPLREIFARLIPDASAIDIERAVATYVDRYDAVGFREGRIFPGVSSMLARLAPGRRLALATVKHTPIARKVLREFSLAQHFEDVFGAEHGGAHSDKTEIVRHLLERMKLDPDRTAFVGDRNNDVTAAKRNGVLAVGAGWGYGSRAELIEAGADELCDSPAEIVRLLCSAG